MFGELAVLIRLCHSKLIYFGLWFLYKVFHTEWFTTESKKARIWGSFLFYDNSFDLPLKVRENCWKVLEKSGNLGLIFMSQTCYYLFDSYK